MGPGDHSRLAYVEVLEDEKAVTASGFTRRAVEWFNRTLLDEWAHVRIYISGDDRVAAMEEWIHIYNHHATTRPSGDHPSTP